jgi:hypothetical protein
LITTLFLGFSFALQGVQLTKLQVFPGGSFDSYVRFIRPVNSNRAGANVYVEHVIDVAGVSRLQSYSDGSYKLEPPIPSYLKFGQKGNYGYLKFKLLPDPYCRPQGISAKQSDDDHVSSLQTTVVNDTAPNIIASLKVGNGLHQLGYAIKPHAFFKDMWVSIKYVGNWTPDIVEAIASAVGALVIKENGPPETFILEPDVDEIRTRAMATTGRFPRTAKVQNAQKFLE